AMLASQSGLTVGTLVLLSPAAAPGAWRRRVLSFSIPLRVLFAAHPQLLQGLRGPVREGKGLGLDAAMLSLLCLRLNPQR
ncbi:MAG: hypothetical protein ACREX9_20720, partial [Gammaproteobacteria bacterium]